MIKSYIIRVCRLESGVALPIVYFVKNSNFSIYLSIASYHTSIVFGIRKLADHLCS